MSGIIDQRLSASAYSTQNPSPVSEQYLQPKMTAPSAISVFKLYKYATHLDRFLIAIGIIASIIAGIGPPLGIIFFGQLANVFIYYASVNTGMYEPSVVADAQENFMKEVYIFLIRMSLVCAMEFTFCYIMLTTLCIAAAKQIYKIRTLFLLSVLHQDVSWFDKHNPADFASQSIELLDQLQDGIGERISLMLYYCSTFICGISIAFVHGWKLTLVILAFTPVMVVSNIVFSKIQAKLSQRELTAYAKAAAIAEENFAGIKTVAAFGGEKIAVQKYEAHLKLSKSDEKKRAIVLSISRGIDGFIIYASYAVAFWYGVELIIESAENKTYEYDPSKLLIIFYCALIGSLNLALTSPHYDAFTVARVAAIPIYEVIERVPTIDSRSPHGEKPPTIQGTVEFHDIFFAYPSRPEVTVLNGVSITIPKGTTVALVGSSGCGKSTLLQLLQRFYDPDIGKVLIDGIDVRNYNLRWLREHIGIVGQEPVLFEASIRKNISFGKEHATFLQVVEASKSANAHNFITKLPMRYHTEVGQRGTHLSGGQKQRIAIARALIQNPQILLLDEATSALDTESEAIVQAALDNARTGRTTIIVAHRLSTIKSADKIVVMSNGLVIETGTHSELMKQKGLYYQLVITQAPIEGEDLGFDESTSARFEVVTKSASQLLYKDEPSEEDLPIRIYPKVSRWKIFRYNSSEIPRIIIGCVAAIGVGFTMPFYAFLFGEITGILSLNNTDEIRHRSFVISMLFLVIGVWSGICTFVQNYCFAVAAGALSYKIRKDVFQAILRQDISWFDLPENSAALLLTKLSTDPSNVQGVSGIRIGIVLQALSSLGVSVALAIYLVPKQALVSIVFIPLLFITNYLQAKLLAGDITSEFSAQENASKIAMEAITNVRTVISLSKEEEFAKAYSEKLKQCYRVAMRNAHIRGFLFGFAEFTAEASYTVSMWYGGYLIMHENVPYKDVFKVAELIVFGTIMVAQSIALSPSYQKGLIAASRCFYLLSRIPPIDSYSRKGLKLPETTPFDLEFYRVQFSYPTRPEAIVLKNASFTIENGNRVAFVGSSGCGKSTCIQLLERYFDPNHGAIFLAEENISDFNISWLRSQMGLVRQEPILFMGTIAENIAYGDNKRNIGMSEIIEAAKKANIHTFVTTLPKGYNTNVGSKGTQLSGGQKQRIAIARALIRNPKILLLDEATSALDTESEKIVQDALDLAMIGRTSIIIAHRLTTIQNADKIVVLHHGSVIEEGTHQNLIAMRGVYYKLNTVQA